MNKLIFITLIGLKIEWKFNQMAAITSLVSKIGVIDQITYIKPFGLKIEKIKNDRLNNNILII